MLKLKKLSAIVLSIGMITSIFSGCASKPVSDKVTQKEVQNPKELKGKIEVMLPAGDYIDFMKKNVIPYFQKEYPNVEVVVSDDKNVDTRIAAGDNPDIYAGTFGYMPLKYAKMDKLVNCEQFSDYKELANRIDEKYTAKSMDGIYYVPWNATTQLMIYNKELFKEAGLDPANPPKTWDEFLAASKKISALPNRKDGSKVYGTVMWNDALSWGGWYWTMMTQVYYNLNDGKYQLFNKAGTDIVFDKPEAKMTEFFELMSKVQECAPPNMEKNFFSRNIGMWLQFGYGWKANFKDAQGSPMEIGKDVAVAPIPVVKAGQTSWSTLDGRSLMIFKSNPDKEKIAWEFVKYLMKDDKNLEACKALGQLPTLKSLQNDPYFTLSENKPFVEQLKNTLPNESIAELDQVANTIQQVYMETVITKKISPQEAVKKAAEKSREILKNKK